MRYLLLIVVLMVLSGSCPTACLKCFDCADPLDPATWCSDVNRDGFTDIEDLLLVTSGWGPCPAIPVWCAPDINGDDVVDNIDLQLVMDGMESCMNSENQFPSTSTQVPNSPGTSLWGNIDNIQADDGSNALSTPGTLNDAITFILEASNFGFTIPTDAEIIGIECKVEVYFLASGNGETIVFSKLGLIEGTENPIGTDLSNSVAITETAGNVHTFGGDQILWGFSPSPFLVNGTHFGVRMEYTVSPTISSPTQIRVDHVNITVFYQNTGASQFFTAGEEATQFYTAGAEESDTYTAGDEASQFFPKKD